MKKKIKVIIVVLLIICSTIIYSTRGYINYITYNITDNPSSLSISFYNTENSRAFTWVTDSSVAESRLFLSTSKGKFDNPFYNGECTATDKINIHKVTVENLNFGTTYYYKLGGNGNYISGEFLVPEKDQTVSFVHLNDAQTKDPNALSILKNTVKTALADTDYDFIAFGGDLYDSNMYYLPKLPSIEKMDGYTYKCIAQNEFPNNIPFVYATGNHEFSTPKLFANFCGFENKSDNALYGYYSFNYDNIHFIVLDSNGAFEEQKKFLEEDLALSLENDSVKWRIVMMHNGPFSTGDHCDDEITAKIAKIFPPVFSKYNVDIVLQAHDHIYSKTAGYEWLNKQGETYYICLGAAGHRYGEASADVYVSGKYKESEYPIKISKLSVSSSIAKKGEAASLNPDFAMTGTVTVTDKKLTYDAYIIDGSKKEKIDNLTIEKLNP